MIVEMTRMLWTWERMESWDETQIIVIQFYGGADYSDRDSSPLLKELSSESVYNIPRGRHMQPVFHTYAKYLKQLGLPNAGGTTRDLKIIVSHLVKAGKPVFLLCDVVTAVDESDEKDLQDVARMLETSEDIRVIIGLRYDPGVTLSFDEWSNSYLVKLRYTYRQQPQLCSSLNTLFTAMFGKDASIVSESADTGEREHRGGVPGLTWVRLQGSENMQGLRASRWCIREQAWGMLQRQRGQQLLEILKNMSTNMTECAVITHVTYPLVKRWCEERGKSQPRLDLTTNISLSK